MPESGHRLIDVFHAEWRSLTSHNRVVIIINDDVDDDDKKKEDEGDAEDMNEVRNFNKTKLYGITLTDTTVPKYLKVPALVCVGARVGECLCAKFYDSITKTM